VTTNPTSAPLLALEPLTVHVEDAVLRDLRARIAATRWPEPSPGVPWEQGTDDGYLRELLGSWESGFDWRRAERWLNSVEHVTTTVDGHPLHLVHQRAADGRGIPVILTHGWPSTFAEYLDVVPLLTDPAAHGLPGPSFDVVIPSLPGYGFSPRPQRTGVDYRFVARLWHQLMQGLGYERYGAAGDDFGAGITTYMALDQPGPLLGIYLSHLEIQPHLGEGSRPLDEAEHAYLAQNERWWREEGGYFEIQSTKPQTLGYGLNDSPAGLAAWVVEKYRSWGDTGGDVESRFSRDFLLTTLTLYWATQTITSSSRDYLDDRAWFRREAGPGPAQRVRVPTGFSTWPAYAGTEGIPPRQYVERLHEVHHWSEMPSGGHFAPVEEPALWAADLAAFFGGLVPPVGDTAAAHSSTTRAGQR
jgi:pimeloyl-ACP methyl ester carboxylesterase